MALRNGTNLRYMHQGSLGSSSVVTDTSGSTVGSIKYYPYGDCRNSTGSLGTDKKFTGQRLDSTGLYYYGARYYDPTIGRFISPDTIVPSPMDPQTINRYTYALNNPTTCTDPTGHWPSWGGVKAFFKGVGSAAVNTVKSTVQMATHPVETAKALAHAVTNPVETFNAIKSDYMEKSKSAEGWGAICFDVVLMAATSGVGGGLGTGERVIASVVGKGTVKTVVKETAEQLTFDFMKEPAFSGKVSGLVIGRTSDLGKAGALATGEYRLGWMSVLETPGLGVKWEKTINFLKLWKVTELGLPIRDATDIAVRKGTFLQMERYMLKKAGWYYNEVAKYWMPPLP